MAKVNGITISITDIEPFKEYLWKYRWHDLSKEPNDLPCPWEYVLITNYKNEVYVAMIDSNHNAWALRDDEFDYCDIGSFMVKAWKEIEPFEENKTFFKE